ncbi:MAG: hypothetical protein QM401_04245 [Bacillota bacterium]|nr:hypothetical protein [Bacillota bacterium]
MRAESTIKPSKRFSIERYNGIATIRFFQNVQKVERSDEEDSKSEAWAYDEFVLQVPDRKGLEDLIEVHYDDWLALAVYEANKPKPKSEKEIVALLQAELDQLQAENAFLLLELAKGEV